MDATPRKMISLISDAYTRFVVPVYQRPYSWDIKQCVQLWDDIVSCGRNKTRAHFTGSIVSIQDGSVSSQGVATLLLIDGQQRTATMTLLLIALARYAATHPQERLEFSREEILASGYLTNQFRTGNDHYKLTLSKGDDPTLRSLIDNLEDPSAPIVDDSPRLLENLDFFQNRINAIADVNVVWEGVRRIEVVSIALTQGQDNPQVIFESMNSTGKDLAPADLIRNFVLMNYPMATQAETYRIYWRPMETTLQATTYDQRFDDFIRAYLAVELAPESLDGRDIYHAFKRYVYSRGYHLGGRIQNLLLKMKRFAGYFASVTVGTEKDPQLRAAFGRLALIGATPMNPLLLSLYEAYDQKACSRDEFLGMLELLESYLLRRAICDCPERMLAGFAASLVARIDAVREEGGNCAQALLAMLLNESGTPRRFPSDAEFSHALKTRNAFDCAQVVFLITGLDTVSRTRELDLSNVHVERIMPADALKSEKWLPTLGDDPERTFELAVNNLGNLRLSTAGDTAESPAGWGPAAIAAHADDLAARALSIWQLPTLPEKVCEVYRSTRRAAPTDAASFELLFKEGVINPGDTLVSADPAYPGSANVTDMGTIVLDGDPDREAFTGPSAAYERLLSSLGATFYVADAWSRWTLGEGGPTLDKLRM